jgi:prevent-host-death family protein
VEPKAVRSVSLTRPKATLSEQLRHVRSTGNQVIVLERGEPVARITPLDPEEHLRATLDVLTAANLVKHAKGELPESFFKPKARR